MTDDLVAFLRARLDETARKALAAADGGSGSWLVRGGLEVCRTEPIDLPGMQPYHRAVVGGAAPAQLHHIAEHDPARVLAEVDAKRELLESYAQAARLAPEMPGATAVEYALRPIVRRLATIYREHPDYRPEWAPEA